MNRNFLLGIAGAGALLLLASQARASPLPDEEAPDELADPNPNVQVKSLAHSLQQGSWTTVAVQFSNTGTTPHEFTREIFLTDSAGRTIDLSFSPVMIQPAFVSALAVKTPVFDDPGAWNLTVRSRAVGTNLVAQEVKLGFLTVTRKPVQEPAPQSPAEEPLWAAPPSSGSPNTSQPSILMQRTPGDIVSGGQAEVGFSVYNTGADAGTFHIQVILTSPSGERLPIYDFTSFRQPGAGPLAVWASKKGLTEVGTWRFDVEAVSQESGMRSHKTGTFALRALQEAPASSPTPAPDDQPASESPPLAFDPDEIRIALDRFDQACQSLRDAAARTIGSGYPPRTVPLTVAELRAMVPDSFVVREVERAEQKLAALGIFRSCR
ncbi:MAG: hypothetical protein Q8R28_09110 [Dehalococcoidia bacterium]|nr:hypothetical protein [Dehalococcoidia bacterium]